MGWIEAAFGLTFALILMAFVLDALDTDGAEERERDD